MDDNVPSPENDWIQRIARGRDEEAFARLYDRYAPMVFSLACRMLPQRQEAEDLLQEVFFYIWERAASFDPQRAPAAGWIIVLTRSRCIDRLRKRALRQGKESPLAVEGSDDSFFPEPGLSTLENLELSERRGEVLKALETLPAPQKTVLEAAYFEGLTQEEIADKFKEPLGTVKTRMRLGLMKLAEFFNASGRGRP